MGNTLTPRPMGDAVTLRCQGKQLNLLYLMETQEKQQSFTATLAPREGICQVWMDVKLKHIVI